MDEIFFLPSKDYSRFFEEAKSLGDIAIRIEWARKETFRLLRRHGMEAGEFDARMAESYYGLVCAYYELMRQIDE